MNKQKAQLAQRYWEIKKSTKIDQNRNTERITSMVEVSQDVVKVSFNLLVRIDPRVVLRILLQLQF